jgi:hypothetical protein
VEKSGGKFLEVDYGGGKILARLTEELMRLPAAVAAARRWGYTVPPLLLSATARELYTLPLAATEPFAVLESGITVQRIIGALVIAGGDAAVKYVSWVTFGDNHKPVYPTGPGDYPTIARPPKADFGVCAQLDAALAIYAERAADATRKLVPAVLGDVAAYARARSDALAAPGADAAIAELSELCKQVPQPCGPLEPSAPASAVVHSVRCDVCGVNPIVGWRWHKTGMFYDVCSDDFALLSRESMVLFELIESPDQAHGTPYSELPGDVFAIAAGDDSTLWHETRQSACAVGRR